MPGYVIGNPSELCEHARPSAIDSTLSFYNTEPSPALISIDMIRLIIDGIVAAVFCSLIWLLLNSAAAMYCRRFLKCGQPTRYPQRVPYLGLDVSKTMNESKYSGKHMNFMQSLFVQLGNTFEATIWGQPWIFTCDMANIKAINTDQAHHFGVEPLRKNANAGWMGDGIFISDGERWKRSRELFKPLFARSHVSDLTRFEYHLTRFFDLLPEDGNTLDLQALFRRLVSLRFILPPVVDHKTHCQPANLAKVSRCLL